MAARVPFQRHQYQYASNPASVLTDVCVHPILLLTKEGGVARTLEAVRRVAAAGRPARAPCRLREAQGGEGGSKTQYTYSPVADRMIGGGGGGGRDRGRVVAWEISGRKTVPKACIKRRGGRRKAQRCPGTWSPGAYRRVGDSKTGSVDTASSLWVPKQARASMPMPPRGNQPRVFLGSWSSRRRLRDGHLGNPPSLWGQDTGLRSPLRHERMNW